MIAYMAYIIIQLTQIQRVYHTIQRSYGRDSPIRWAVMIVSCQTIRQKLVCHRSHDRYRNTEFAKFCSSGVFNVYYKHTVLNRYDTYNLSCFSALDSPSFHHLGSRFLSHTSKGESSAYFLIFLYVTCSFSPEAKLHYTILQIQNLCC